MNLRVPAILSDEYEKDTLRHSLETSDPIVARQSVTLQKAEFIEKEKAKKALASLSELVGQLPPDQKQIYENAGGLVGLEMTYQATNDAMAFATVLDSDHDCDEMHVDPLEAKIQKYMDIAAYDTLADCAQNEGKVLKALGKEIEGLVFGLREMAQIYISENDTVLQTADAYHYAVRRFIELNGDLALKDLKLSHLNNFAVRVLKLPKSNRSDIRPLTFDEAIRVADAEDLPRIGPKTRDKHINLLKSLMKHAIKIGKLDPPNIWRDYSAVQPKSKFAKERKSRAPFSGETMIQILDYVKKTYNPSTIDFWAPLLACYQGMRREEIGQLLIDDIRKSKGIWCINISDEDESQKVKNRTSFRLIPVHAKVVEAGFLTFVKKRKAREGCYLFLEKDRWKQRFEEVKPDVRGRFTESYGKRFSRILREKLNIKDTSQVFHSFRHSWEDAARAASISDAHRRHLAGRSADKGSQAAYGDGYQVDSVSKSLDKVDPLSN